MASEVTGPGISVLLLLGCHKAHCLCAKKYIEHLKESIKREVEVIRADKDLLQKVCNSVTGRVGECINASGWHFEKYR